MKVTGVLIRNELKMLTTELSAVNNGFNDILTYTEGDEKPNVLACTGKMLGIERKIAIWQYAQKMYNTKLSVDFGGEIISLQEAVSVIGGYSRIAKLLRTAAGAGKKDPYSSRRRYVDASATKQVKDSITTDEAIAAYKQVERNANTLRAAISKANNTEVEVYGLDKRLAEL